jgi:hypothetical protein
MKFTSRDWIAVIGKAFSGKTFWIRAHIEKVPKNRLYIMDFNCSDYQDFTKKAEIWNMDGDAIDQATKFMGICYNKGNCTVVLGDADNYLWKDNPTIRAFVTTGRNRGIGVLADLKRPMAVRPQLRTRFNYLVLFQTTLPEDQEYLEQWCGVEKGRFAMLSTLQQGDFIIADTDRQTISDVKRL